jgi:hypothetical protein
VEPLTRREALAQLEDHGVRGPDVYLIDVIPLIDMLWADGCAQTVEVALLEAFMRRHVEDINEVAGTTVLTPAAGARFLRRHLEVRPDPAVLRILERMIPPVRLSSSDEQGSQRWRRSILEWCLDIGAACVAEYPFGDRERFCQKEKDAFLGIADVLGLGPDGTPPAEALTPVRRRH